MLAFWRHKPWPPDEHERAAAASARPNRDDARRAAPDGLTTATSSARHPADSLIHGASGLKRADVKHRKLRVTSKLQTTYPLLMAWTGLGS